jgi:hypothetical protein
MNLSTVSILTVDTSICKWRPSVEDKKIGDAKMRRPRKKKFHTRYRHYRTGKMMIAKEYGYKAWPF